MKLGVDRVHADGVPAFAAYVAHIATVGRAAVRRAGRFAGRNLAETRKIFAAHRRFFTHGADVPGPSARQTDGAPATDDRIAAEANAAA